VDHDKKDKTLDMSHFLKMIEKPVLGEHLPAKPIAKKEPIKEAA